jgi:Secretion system C-terminal sorting domain
MKTTNILLAFLLLAFSNFLCAQSFIEESSLDSFSIDQGDNISEINVFPKPSNGKLSVQFELIEAQEVIIELYASDGRLVKEIMKSRMIYPGTHTISLFLNDLRNGTYTLILRTEKFKHSEQVLLVK